MSDSNFDTLKAELRAKGLGLLSRREYAARELRSRLQQAVAATADADLVSVALDEVVARLQDENYQSDERFAEMLVTSRSRKGYGPRVIRQELTQQGVANDIVDNVLQRLAIDWETSVSELVQRRFGRDLKQPKTQLKARQFLYRRGFESDVIQICLKTGVAD